MSAWTFSPCIWRKVPQRSSEELWPWPRHRSQPSGWCWGRLLDLGNVQQKQKFILITFFFLFIPFFFYLSFFPVITPLFSFFSSAHIQQRMLGSCQGVKCTVQITWVFFSRDLLGGEESWPFLLASNVVPALIQLTALPWLPESPRYLLIDRGDEESCISGEFRVTVILSLSMEDLWQGR